MMQLPAGHWCLQSAVTMTDMIKQLADDFRIECFEEQNDSTTLLDDYDRDIWQANQVLLLTAKKNYRLYSGEETIEYAAGTTQMRFWWDFPDTPIQHKLRKLIDLRALLPIAELGLASQQFVLRNSDEKIVVRGELSALRSDVHDAVAQHDEKPRVSTFVSLQGLRGYEKEFQQALDNLQALIDKPLPSLSLKSRIQCHGFDVQLSSKVFGIEAHEPVEKALRQMSLSMLNKARENEAGVIDDIDTEFLHQYRVSLRKTRSLLNLMKKALPEALHLRLKEQLGKIASATNNLRDLDVFLLEKNHYQSMLPPTFAKGVEQLFSVIAQQREKARREVVKTFQSVGYEQSFAEVLQTLQQSPLYATELAARPVKTVASKKILGRFEKIRRLGILIDADTPAEQVHDLRIECKKLRYMMEFFAELYADKAIKPLIKSLKKLQTILGDFNDYEVQQAFLAGYEKANRSKPALSAACNGLIALLYQQQMQARAQVMDAFAQFNLPDNVEAFEQLFTKSRPEQEPS